MQRTNHPVPLADKQSKKRKKERWLSNTIKQQKPQSIVFDNVCILILKITYHRILLRQFGKFGYKLHETWYLVVIINFITCDDARWFYIHKNSHQLEWHNDSRNDVMSKISIKILRTIKKHKFVYRMWWGWWEINKWNRITKILIIIEFYNE